MPRAFTVNDSLPQNLSPRCIRISSPLFVYSSAIRIGTALWYRFSSHHFPALAGLSLAASRVARREHRPADDVPVHRESIPFNGVYKNWHAVICSICDQSSMDGRIALRKKHRESAEPALFDGRSDFLKFPHDSAVWQTWPDEMSVWINYKYAKAHQGYVLAR